MSDPRRRPYAESARGARLGARSPRHYLPGLLVQAPQRRPSGGGGIPLQDPGLAPGSSATPQSPVGAHPPEDLGVLQRRPLGRDALSTVVPPETLSPSSSAPPPGRDAPSASVPPGVRSLSFSAAHLQPGRSPTPPQDAAPLPKPLSDSPAPGAGIPSARLPLRPCAPATYTGGPQRLPAPGEGAQSLCPGRGCAR